MKINSLLIAMIALVSVSADALEGYVVGEDGQAVEGATIEAVGRSASATTDAKGYFELKETDVEEVHISAAGFSHQTHHIEADELDQAVRIVLVDSVIEQVDVIGIPLHASIIESAMPIHILSGEKLRNKQAATLGDSLANEVGVHTNFHGNVASTPIIRGLSGPRVLITQNGLDVSDASRVGPDHSVSTEVSTAEQIEVLRGPATLFYGSGAFGGVVNVVDKRVPTDTETYGEWLVSHDTVNEQNLASFNANTGSGNVALHLDGFWRESDDYEVPVSPEIDEDHGERTVDNSAEESSGFTVGGSYLLDNGYVGISYGNLEREHGIPGHGHGEEEHDDEHHEEESVLLKSKQDRYQLISELAFDHAFISELNTRVGYTDYSHREIEEGGGTRFSNKTSEASIELLHQRLSDWRGGFVFDYKNSTFSAVGDEAFAPPSETNTFAVALLEERHFGDVLVQFGARAEHVNVQADEVMIPEVEFHHHDEEEEHEEAHEEGEHEEAFNFDEDYTPVSFSFGAVWGFTQGYNVGISLSHSERAPSAAEMLSFGPHIATGLFEIGALYELHEEDDEVHFEPRETAPGLEKSNNIDLTFRKFEGDTGVILNVFYNQVDNYYAQFDTGLYAEAGHAHGEEEEHEEEEGELHEDELPVYHFESADVNLYGFEAQGIWQINNSLKTTLFSDYVRAEFDGGGNVARIPPMRAGINFDFVYEQLSANFDWTHYSKQDNVAELETKTDGYNWVSANVNYHIPLNTMELTLFLKGENLTNEEARVHSSFLKDLAPRPGRNFRIGVRGTF